MKSIAIAAAASLLIAGCKPQSSYGMQEIPFKAGQSPAIVLIEPLASTTCKGVDERTLELRASKQIPKSAPNGLRFVDLPAFRAYLIAGRDEQRASFVFCNGAGSPYVPNRCALVGRGSNACYQASVHGIQASDLASLDGTLAKRMSDLQ